MGEAATREEGPDGCDEQPAGRPERRRRTPAVTSWSSASRGPSATMGRPAAGRAPAPPRLRAHGAGAWRVLPVLLRDRAGQQGDPAGRPPLPVRPRPLPDRHRRAAHREPDRRGVAGAPLPGPRPHARPRPRRLGHGRGRSPRTAEPVRRDGHRREPAGRGPAGRRGAARPAPGLPRPTRASWRRWSRGRSSTGS